MDEDDGQEKERPRLPPKNVILDEFKKVLPRLKDDEHATLQRNIKRDGLLTPLALWKRPDGTRVLLDGHHRAESCEELGIELGPENFIELEFDSADEAKRWIIDQHKGRRNVVDWAAIIAHLDSPLRKQFEAEAAEKKQAGRPKGGKVSYGEDAVSSKRAPTADDKSAAHLGTTTHQVRKARQTLRNNDPNPAQAKRTKPPARATISAAGQKKKRTTTIVRGIGKAIEDLDISMDRLRGRLGTHWDNPEPEVIKSLRPRLTLLLQKMRGYVAKVDALVLDDAVDD